MHSVGDLVEVAAAAGIDLRHDGRGAYPDFCFDPVPVPSVVHGLRPGAVIVATFLSGRATASLEVAGSVVRGLGDSRTIWAARWRNGELSWEVYLYNTRAASVPLESFAAALRPVVRWSPPAVPAGLPADVFSVDLDGPALQGDVVDTVHVYLPGPGLGRRGGFSYRISPDGIVMENVYAVYGVPEELGGFDAAAAASPHLRGYRSLLGGALPADLGVASLLHVAHKPTVDGLYLSRLEVPVAIDVLERSGWPAEVVARWRVLEPELTGVRLDVGVDLRLDGHGCTVQGTTVFACV